jgi:HJR/Mrr/RecB family endonuclease
MGTTNTINITLQILFPVFSLVFSFWFLAVLGPITNKKRSKNILRDMFIIWSMLAVLRFIMLFDTKPIPSMVVPEPLNTILFMCAGLVLLIGTVLFQRFQNGKFQKKANTLRQIDDFLQLSPREFEDMIVELYHRAGHKAKSTGAAGDHGVDVVIEAKNGEKWVVQCKRWKGSVGEPVVRDFYGVVQHEKADKGIIFTTGRYSAPAQQWAKGKPISLYDGNKLVELWSRSKGQLNQTHQVAMTQ